MSRKERGLGGASRWAAEQFVWSVRVERRREEASKVDRKGVQSWWDQTWLDPRYLLVFGKEPLAYLHYFTSLGETMPIFTFPPRFIKGILLFNQFKRSFWASSQLGLYAFKMAYNYL